MKTETKELLECFCKEVKSLLLCSNAEKEKFLCGLRTNIEEYLDDHPDITMKELQAHFGKPEDVANSYQYAIGEAEVRKRIRKKRQLWYFMAFAMAMVVIVGLILLAIFMTKATNELPNYYFSVESSAEQMNSLLSETLNDPNTIIV